MLSLKSRGEMMGGPSKTSAEVGGISMRAWKIGLLVVLFLALCGLKTTQAHEEYIYPPMGPCIGLPEGISFYFEGDPDHGIPPYEACDITGLSDLGDYVIICPEGTFPDEIAGGCILSYNEPIGQPVTEEDGTCWDPTWIAYDGHCYEPTYDPTYGYLLALNGNCPTDIAYVLFGAEDPANVLGQDICWPVDLLETDSDEIVESESTEIVTSLPNTGTGETNDALKRYFLLCITACCVLLLGICSRMKKPQ